LASSCSAEPSRGGILAILQIERLHSLQVHGGRRLPPDRNRGVAQ